MTGGMRVAQYGGKRRLTRHHWFHHCRSRGDVDLKYQLALLEHKKQFLKATIADLKRLLAAHERGAQAGPVVN